MRFSTVTSAFTTRIALPLGIEGLEMGKTAHALDLSAWPMVLSSLS
jgi:hypothetical protein